jgi:uncharacterized membrane protein YdjX (TVP38/TMEM64 family)
MKKLTATVIGLVLLASPLVLTLPLKEWFDHSEALRTALAELGPWAPLAFTIGTAAATALGMPRLIFCIVAGWLFGFEWGFVWSQLGSLLGAYGLFLVARSTTPERLLKKYPALRSISMPAGTGWFSVLLVRQLPLAGLYNDILLGWSPVSHRDFWIGSFIGFLPLGITASLIGAGAIQADLARMGGYFAGASLAFVALSFSVNRLVARKSRLNAGTT